MVVSGRAEMVPGAEAEAERQLWLRYRLSAATADAYAAAGFTAIVQDVILGPGVVERYLDQIVTRPRHLVVLAPSVAAVADRERAREKTGYGEWTVEELDSELRGVTPQIGLWIDSADQTPDQTVDEILERLSDARLD